MVMLQENEQVLLIASQNAAAQLRKIATLLEQIRDAVSYPETGPDAAEGKIYRIHVVSVNGVEAGPDMLLPHRHYPVTIRQRRHSDGNTHTGYWSFTDRDVRDTIFRSEMRDNDSYTVRVSNLNKLYFSANTANTYFELVVEK